MIGCGRDWLVEWPALSLRGCRLFLLRRSPGVAGAEQLRAREALQPDTLVLDSSCCRALFKKYLGGRRCQLVEEGWAP
jgi:hypothetical protein